MGVIITRYGKITTSSSGNQKDNAYRSAINYSPEDCLEYCTRDARVSWKNDDIVGGTASWKIGDVILLIIEATTGDTYFSYQTVTEKDYLTPKKSYWIEYKGEKGEQGLPGPMGPPGPKNTDAIEEILINDIPLTKTAQKVTLPLATNSVLGIIKGNDVENGILITDGLPLVKNLNVNRLTQTPGEDLILNSGDAQNIKEYKNI